MYQFDEPEAKELRFALIGAVLGAVWVTICLRFWVRMGYTRNFTWDDGFCLFSAISLTGSCTMGMLVESFGIRHSEQDEDIYSMLMLSAVSTELYIVAICTVKISTSLFYLRYAESHWQRYAANAVILLSVTTSVLLIAMTLLECGALSDDTGPGRQSVCLQTNIVYTTDLATGVINAATSWTLVAIPIFVMASRFQSLPLRICIGCVVLLGVCVGVVSVVRVVSLSRATIGVETDIVPLSYLECGMAIVAACIATLRPLFPFLAPPPLSDLEHIKHLVEKDTEQVDKRFTDQSSTPSKSHFSFFGEITPNKSHFSFLDETSSGPKSWFKGLCDIGRSIAEHPRNTLDPGLRQKSTPMVGERAISHPVAGAIRPPLNRAESQQYLLRNVSDSSRRDASSPDLFLKYGAVERM